MTYQELLYIMYNDSEQKRVIFYINTSPAVQGFVKSDNDRICITYSDFQQALTNNDKFIHTTELSGLSFDLIKRGYDIYIVNDNTALKIYPGMSTASGKDIRIEHNILKLFLGGVFDEDLNLQKIKKSSFQQTDSSFYIS